MPTNKTLKVATCQLAVGSDIQRNSRQIQKQILSAQVLGAEVVHFSECALGGYAGVAFTSWKKYDWDTLHHETEKICQLAKKTKLWIILGSNHRLTGSHLPHNSLYVISPKGEIVERYDKRFCTEDDLKYYTSGNHFPVVKIKGVLCGLLICYDLRFPELYRAYQKLGVRCIFDSFHNARKEGPTIHTTIMRPSLQAHASANYMWISAPNSSGYYQLWQSVFILPNGVIAKSLTRHKAGVMVNTIDLDESFYDASAPFRKDAMKGKLYSGKLVRDKRSRDKTIY